MPFPAPLRWRRLWKRVWPPFLLLAILLYFGVQAVRGDRGLLAWFRLEDETQALQTEVDRLTREREALEQRVRQMRSESLDPDRLDEEVRRQLGFTREDERIILDPPDRQDDDR